MSYSLSQINLKRVALEKDLDQALDRMVNFEEEVNRNNEKEENANNFAQLVGGYLFGVVVGLSLVNICSYINGGTKNNQR